VTAAGSTGGPVNGCQQGCAWNFTERLCIPVAPPASRKGFKEAWDFATLPCDLRQSGRPFCRDDEPRFRLQTGLKENPHER